MCVCVHVCELNCSCLTCVPSSVGEIGSRKKISSSYAELNYQDNHRYMYIHVSSQQRFNDNQTVSKSWHGYLIQYLNGSGESVYDHSLIVSLTVVLNDLLMAQRFGTLNSRLPKVWYSK